MYQKRHNRIVDLVYDRVKATASDQTIITMKDCILKPDMFGSLQENFRHPSTRPDIVKIDRDQRHVIIMKLLCPLMLI